VEYKTKTLTFLEGSLTPLLVSFAVGEKLKKSETPKKDLDFRNLVTFSNICQRKKLTNKKNIYIRYKFLYLIARILGQLTRTVQLLRVSCSILVALYPVLGIPPCTVLGLNPPLPWKNKFKTFFLIKLHQS
jgi:hypothetical protein